MIIIFHTQPILLGACYPHILTTKPKSHTKHSGKNHHPATDFRANSISFLDSLISQFAKISVHYNRKMTLRHLSLQNTNQTIMIAATTSKLYHVTNRIFTNTSNH